MANIVEKQLKEQKKQTKILQANTALSAAQLQAQREANRQLAVQTRMMADEAARKAYQKRIKGMLFSFRQIAERIPEFQAEPARYIAARLIAFGIENEGLSTEAFEEIPDKTYLADLQKLLTQTANSVSAPARDEGEKYLDVLARKFGELSLLARLRNGARSLPTFIGNLLPFPIVFLANKHARGLWDALSSLFNVAPVKNFSDLLAKGDETETRLLQEISVFRASNVPEVASVAYTGMPIEPTTKSAPAPKSPIMSMVAIPAAALVLLLVVIIAAPGVEESNKLTSERTANLNLMPPAQQAFVQAVAKLESSPPAPDAAKQLSVLIQQNSPFYGWLGEIAAIDKTAATHIGVKIRLRGTAAVLTNYAGESASETEQYVIRAGTPLHAVLAKLEPGTTVRFSGALMPVVDASGKQQSRLMVTDVAGVEKSKQ